MNHAPASPLLWARRRAIPRRLGLPRGSGGHAPRAASKKLATPRASPTLPTMGIRILAYCIGLFTLLRELSFTLAQTRVSPL